MTDRKKVYYKEIKATLLFLLSFLGFLLIDSSKLLIYTIIFSLVACLDLLYVKVNKLKFSTRIINLILAFYNVISLLFMVQYFIASNENMRVHQIFLAPFIDNGNYMISYIIWIFVYSLFLLLLQSDKVKFSGEYYGR